MVVTAKHGSAEEERTKRMIEDLLRAHDLSRFAFTDGVVADYLHEQLHGHGGPHAVLHSFGGGRSHAGSPISSS